MIANHVIAKRINALQAKRQRLAALPPEKATAAILDDERALELVHSFAEEDLHLLLHDIGPEDALPLLALASNKQWEYLVDIDTWNRDRMDNPAVLRWFDRMLAADSRRLIRLCLHDWMDLFELFVRRNVTVRICDADRSPSDLEDDAFTFDNVFYFNVPDILPASDLGMTADDAAQYNRERKEFFLKLFKRLAEADYQRFQNLIMEAAALIPAEAEETLYRLRNIRLAEKGFVPFAEAVGIYQPMTPDALRDRRRKTVSGGAAGLQPPLSPGRLIDPDSPFSIALQHIDSPDTLRQLQVEFAALCNQLIVADQKTVKTQENLAEVVRKTGGYISIGLVQSFGRYEKNAAALRRTLTAAPLVDFFRVGVYAVLQLKQRAKKWFTDSWFRQKELPLTFWGDAWMGVLGGLLLKRPLYFDNYRTGVIYREFLSAADVDETSTTLDEMMAVDRLLTTLDIAPAIPGTYNLLTCHSLLLTAWARHCTESREGTTVQPLPLKKFRPFYESLWESGPPPRRITAAAKTSFLKWISTRSGLAPSTLTDRLGGVFEKLFAAVENEYGSVAPGDLDPRFIILFLVQK